MQKTICIYIYMTFHFHDVALLFLQHVHLDGVFTYLSPVQSGGVKLRTSILFLVH